MTQAFFPGLSSVFVVVTTLLCSDSALAQRKKLKSPDKIFPGYILESNKESKYPGVEETLYVIRSTKNEIFYTSNLKAFLVSADKAFRLGLIIENEVGKNLIVRAPGKEPIKVSEYWVKNAVNSICDYIKPLLLEKLDSVGYKPDFSEYVSDFLFTSIDHDARLLAYDYAIASQSSQIDIGARLSKTPAGTFKIKFVKRNSICEKGDVRTGDEIISVNKIPAKFLGGGALDKTLSLKNGEFAQLVIKRSGEIISKTLMGDKTEPLRIRDSLITLPGNILYVRVFEMIKGTAKKVEVFIKENTPHNGVIFDLRKCEGGLFDECIDLARLFVLEKDTVTRIRYSSPQDLSPRLFLGGSTELLPQNKLLILVDEQTAAGAELIAGSLKYNRAAKIMGHKTPGFGELGGFSFIGHRMYCVWYNAGEMLLPDNLQISGTGVIPDVYIDVSRAVEEAISIIGK